MKNKMEKNKDFLLVLRNTDERINGKCTDEDWNETVEQDWDGEGIGFLQDEFLKSRDSFASSQAIEFAEWMYLNDYVVVSESDLNVYWTRRIKSIPKTTAQLLSEFIEWKKQQEGRGE